MYVFATTSVVKWSCVWVCEILQWWETRGWFVRIQWTSLHPPLCFTALRAQYASSVLVNRHEINTVLWCSSDYVATKLTFYIATERCVELRRLSAAYVNNCFRKPTVLAIAVYSHFIYWLWFVSDIAIFVLKRDVKLQLTN